MIFLIHLRLRLYLIDFLKVNQFSFFFNDLFFLFFIGILLLSDKSFLSWRGWHLKVLLIWTHWFILLFNIIFYKTDSFIFSKHPLNLIFLSLFYCFFRFVATYSWIFCFWNYMSPNSTPWIFYLLIFNSLSWIHLSSKRSWFSINLNVWLNN